MTTHEILAHLLQISQALATEQERQDPVLITELVRSCQMALDARLSHLQAQQQHYEHLRQILYVVGQLSTAPQSSTALPDGAPTRGGSATQGGYRDQ